MIDERFDPLHVLAELHARHVRFVLVGDLAAMAHGSTLSTDRVEVCVADDDEDVERLADVLDLLEAERIDDEDDPYRVAFRTAAGRLDAVELAGGNGFSDLEARAVPMPVGHGVVVNVAAPEDLVVLQLASDDLIGAVRSTAMRPPERSGSDPRILDEDEFGPEIDGRPATPWRRVVRALEDVDRFMTDLNEGKLPDRRRRS
jgi:hypothetical protein